MRSCRWLLFALVFAVPLAQADPLPRDEPGNPAKEPDALPGRVRLALDPGGHTAGIEKVLFTPDGKHLISMSEDGTIRVYDGQTGQHLRVLRPPGVRWQAPAFSPDGRTLAFFARYRMEGKAKPVIYLMALADGRIERVLQGLEERIDALAFSPDGKRLVSAGTDKTLRIWNLDRGEPEKTIKIDWLVNGLTFSPDGANVVESRVDDTPVIRNLASGKAIPLAGHKDPMWLGTDRVAWSADGKTIAAVGHDGLWLFEPDGKLRRHLLPGALVTSVAVSPNAPRVLAAGYGPREAWIFGLQGKQRLTFGLKEFPRGQEYAATRCALSPDGTLAATAGMTNGAHEIFLWRTDNGTLVHRIAVAAWLTGRNLHAGWSADGKSIAWRKVKNADAWKGRPTTFELQDRDGEMGLAARPLVGDFRGALEEKGGVRLQQSPDHPVQVHKNGRPIPLQLPPDRPPYSGLRHTLIDENRAAITWWDTIYLVDLNTGKPIQQLMRHGGGVETVAPSPDGRFLLSHAHDQILRLWSVAEGKLLLSLFVQDNEWIAWARGGYYAASPGGEKLMGWLVDNGIEQAPSYHPAARFRKHFYRPDIVKLVLEKGSVEEALKVAGVQSTDIGQALPPRTTVSRKQDGARVLVEATAQASSKEQPVTELALLVDGRPARLGDGQVAVKTFETPLEKDARGAWNLTLEPGKHKLSVRATSKDAYSISSEVVVEVEGTTKKGKLYYVGIGVNQFQVAGLNLVGAVPDVRNMEKCLKDHCTNRYQVETTVLTDKEATLAAVLKTLKDLQGKLKPTDVAIVHYSSHGETDPTDGSLYLLTHDSKIGNFKETALPGQKLRDLLGDYPCPVLLILDACKSGKFPLSRSPVDSLSRMLADDSCGVAVLTAALAHQKAQDTEKGGVFTLALVEGLSGKARPEEESRKLYVHHLFIYTFDTVAKQTSMKQMPLYLPSGSVPPIVLKEEAGK